MKFASWKTSAAGVGAILTALGTACTYQFDNDPTTSPDWAVVVVAIVAGLGLLFARDNKVSSEQAGAGKP